MNATFWLGADGDPDALSAAEAKRIWDAVMMEIIRPAKPRRWWQIWR
jgi:hypothetical protein